MKNSAMNTLADRSYGPKTSKTPNHESINMSFENQKGFMNANRPNLLA